MTILHYSFNSMIRAFAFIVLFPLPNSSDKIGEGIFNVKFSNDEIIFC